MVDKVGGITILSEIGVQQLSDEQKQKVSRFIKPFPYREISLIYYKPTYKQKIIDELISEIRTSMEQKLNFYKDQENYVSIKPE